MEESSLISSLGPSIIEELRIAIDDRFKSRRKSPERENFGKIKIYATQGKVEIKYMRWKISQHQTFSGISLVLGFSPFLKTSR